MDVTELVAITTSVKVVIPIEDTDSQRGSSTPLTCLDRARTPSTTCSPCTRHYSVYSLYRHRWCDGKEEGRKMISMLSHVVSWYVPSKILAILTNC